MDTRILLVSWLIIGTVNGVVFGTLIGCLIAWFRSIEYETNEVRQWMDELEQRRARFAAIDAEREVELAKAKAEAEAERLDSERWGVIRTHCPVLEPHMASATVGEVKRALALPEVQDFISKHRELLITVKPHQTPRQDPYFQADLQSLHMMNDEEFVPRDDCLSRGLCFAFGAWLEDLILEAHASDQEER